MKFRQTQDKNTNLGLEQESEMLWFLYVFYFCQQ
jgi:hypothetical protein